MPADEIAGTTQELASNILGVWWLLSREDFTEDGRRVVDPTLGESPLGILTYAPDHFAAQFMKRDRSGTEFEMPGARGQNNTGAIGGYDAYFGTYKVDQETGDVLHRLEGALTRDNVGLEVLRKLSVEGDRLVIRLETTTTEGEPISRTLVWRRVG